LVVVGGQDLVYAALGTPGGTYIDNQYASSLLSLNHPGLPNRFAPNGGLALTNNNGVYRVANPTSNRPVWYAGDPLYPLPQSGNTIPANVIPTSIMANNYGQLFGVAIDAASQLVLTAQGVRLVQINPPVGNLINIGIDNESPLEFASGSWPTYSGPIVGGPIATPITLGPSPSGISLNSDIKISAIAGTATNRLPAGRFADERRLVAELCGQRMRTPGRTARTAAALMSGSALFTADSLVHADLSSVGGPKQGEVIALDAKLNFDDNALYRHKEIAALRDPDEEDPREAQAKVYDLSYVGLEGNIGCMVNGAGLAMATMDMIKLAGGQPANFLDVGGGADEEKVTAAFKLLLSDPQVKAVLVNIFGGIMRCTTIATAIIEAYKTVTFNVPLVVRLEGTEVVEARKLLAESKLNIIGAEGLTDAAKKVVAAAK